MIDIRLVKALFRMGVHPRDVTSMQVAKYMHITNQDAKARLGALNRRLFGDTRIATENTTSEGMANE